MSIEIRFQIPVAPEWIINDTWALRAWNAGWERFYARCGEGFRAPEISDLLSWEEVLTSPGYQKKMREYRSAIAGRCIQFAPLATKAIEESLLPAAQGDGYFGTVSGWVNSARRAVDALKLEI
jgi:hypothetical protein